MRRAAASVFLEYLKTLPVAFKCLDLSDPVSQIAAARDGRGLMSANRFFESLNEMRVDPGTICDIVLKILEHLSRISYKTFRGVKTPFLPFLTVHNQQHHYRKVALKEVYVTIR